MGPQAGHWVTGHPGSREAVDWPAVGNERTRRHAAIAPQRPNGRPSRLTKHETPARLHPEGLRRKTNQLPTALLLGKTLALGPPLFLASSTPKNPEQRRSQICKRRLVLCLADRGPHMPAHMTTLGSPALADRPGLLFIYLDSVPTTGKEAPGHLCGGHPLTSVI